MRPVLTLFSALAIAAGAAPVAAAGQHESARVWITTPDGAMKMADAGQVDFTSTPATVPTVVVDASRTFQTMEGFGASITDSSAAVLYRLSPRARFDAMRDLFDTRTGDGLSYLRQPVGASDFVAEAAYTYDDVPAGETDYDLRHFTIAHDEKQILPLLRTAKFFNPGLRINATPWSPPAWMKTGGSLIGGRLIDDPRIYRAYAAYLVKFIQAYRAHGITVDTIAVQNEPQNRTPSGYPGTDLPSWQEAKVIEQLGPMLRDAHLRTKILGYDHNWVEHPGDIGHTPPDETADINAYPQNLMNSAAAKWIGGIAYHCYAGDPSAMSAFHKQFPKVDLYFTECSGITSANPADTFSDTLKWHTRNLVLGNTRNWAKTVLNWNLALDPTGGPHVGGCGTCTGVITVNPDGTVTRNAEYYTLGHLARFVKSGAVRIASTSFGTTGWNGQVMTAAFRNPDGSTVLVAHNENDNPQAFAVRDGDRDFSYTLPGGALATFVWRGHSGARALDPAGWTASAPAAVDDDATTSFSAPQTAGASLQIDFGSNVRAREVVLDTGVSIQDYPRGYTAAISSDGVTWTTVVAAGVGNGQFTTVNLRGERARFVRFTLTAAAASPWTVADVRAYS
ncbi:glycoside hydrolase family 30 beta sandwich domain-containing protein [Actinocrispum sp. NPDC049592]|uniref:glycoside hydrolase family 30 beta sandwich domain-containing protein n=1 Tax=Actinocrispum sp. NPDC049592 TaxID=3154835 RepID=UPI003417C448